MFEIKGISPNKNKFEIKASSAKTVEMFIYGDISRYDISAKEVGSALKELDAKVSNIDIRLLSPGGDVFEGIAIYNLIKRQDRKVTVYVDGLAGSIASIIMLAGDEVVMGEGSQVFIHKPWSIKAGNANDFQEMIEQLDRVENEMLKIYSKKMNASDTEILKMMSDETWFNSDEALEYGLVDKISDENDMQMSISACVKSCEWIKKKELAKTNLEFQNKLNETINKFNDVLARK